MKSLGLSTYQACRQLLPLVAVLFIGLSLALTTPVATGKEIINPIHGLSKSLKSPAVRAHVLSVLNISAGASSTYLERATLGKNAKLNLAKAHMDGPGSNWHYVASTSYDNCGGISAHRTVSITHSVEDSIEWSVENSFGVGVTAEASFDTTFAGTAFGISANYDFTSSKGGSKTESKEVSDEQAVEFPDERGVYVFALYVRALLSDGWIPYSMDFTLGKTTPVTFTFVDQTISDPPKRIEIYSDLEPTKTDTIGEHMIALEGRHYDFTNPYSIGAHMLRKTSRFYLEPGTYVQFFYDGGSKIFYPGGVSSRRSIRRMSGAYAKYNDRFTGVYVAPYRVHKKTVAWGKVADQFPNADTTFRIAGRMQYKKTDVNDVKMVSYRLNDAAVDEECGVLGLPPGVAGKPQRGGFSKPQRGGHASAVGGRRTAAPRHTGQGNKVSKATFDRMMGKGELHAVKL